jgi:tetratricopeptide (TPR) repeat protein
MSLPRFSAVFLTVSLAVAQVNRPMPGSSTGSGFPGADGSGSNTNGTTAPASIAHPIALTGKVTLDDGSVPSEPVKIERVCLGRVHAEGFTDGKGRFSVTIGQDADTMADASEIPTRSQMGGLNPLGGGGARDTQIQNCDLRAELAGYRSDAISLANHRYLDSPDLGTIVLHRVSNVEGLTISATSALAPKDARKAYEKGLDAVRKNKPDEAQKEFQRAVEIYSKYAAAWFELGRVYESRDHSDQALESYKESIAADSNYINPYERIYEIDANEGKWQEVADTSDKVLRLNPYDFPRAYYFNAFANMQLKKLDAAEKSAREAVKLDMAHQNPRSWYVLGIILANKQDFAAAAGFLREYLQYEPDPKDSDKIRQQLADIEKEAQAKAQ